MYRLQRRRLGDTSRRRTFVKMRPRTHTLPLKQLFMPAVRSWYPVSQRSSIEAVSVRGKMFVKPIQADSFKSFWLRPVIRIFYDNYPTNATYYHSSSYKCGSCGRSCNCTGSTI